MSALALILAGILIPVAIKGENSTVNPKTEDLSLAYIEPYYIPPAKANCSCVLFVRSLGVDAYGSAGSIKPNSTEPFAGGAVLLREGKIGHVAYILDVQKDGIVIMESNFIPCKITFRFIPFDYGQIKGYLI